jgi:hypothetical protein
VPLGSFEAAGRSACIEATSSRRFSCAQLRRRKCGLPTVGSRSGIAIGGFGGSQLGILSGVPIGAPNVKVPNGNAHWRIPIRSSNLKMPNQELELESSKFGFLPVGSQLGMPIAKSNTGIPT